MNNEMILWHTGYLVHDLDAAIREMERLPGMGKMEPVEIAFSQEEVLIGPAFSCRIAMGMCCGSLIELVQPLGNDSFMAKGLAKKGPGIHHLAYAIPGAFDETVASLVAAGWSKPMAACKAGIRNCFVVSSDGVTVLELIERIPD